MNRRAQLERLERRLGTDEKQERIVMTILKPGDDMETAHDVDARAAADPAFREWLQEQDARASWGRAILLIDGAGRVRGFDPEGSVPTWPSSTRPHGGRNE